MTIRHVNFSPTIPGCSRPRFLDPSVLSWHGVLPGVRASDLEENKMQYLMIHASNNVSKFMHAGDAGKPGKKVYIPEVRHLFLYGLGRPQRAGHGLAC
jgi:hypothetical protein